MYENYAFIGHVIKLVVMGGHRWDFCQVPVPTHAPGLCGLTGDRVPADATSGSPVVDWIVETRIQGAVWWTWWWPLGWHALLPINSYRVDEWATLAGPAMHVSHILERAT